MEPVHQAVTNLKSTRLLPGDSYAEWLLCKISLKKMTSPIARELFAAMETHESELLKNEILLSALYLDPRFIVLILNIEDADTSILHDSNDYESYAWNALKQLWIRLQPARIEEKSVQVHLKILHIKRS